MTSAVWGAGVKFSNCWCQLSKLLFLGRVAFSFFFIWGTSSVHNVTGLSKRAAASCNWGSLGDSGKEGAGSVPGAFPWVWEWMVGTITVLWMEALKEATAEKWHGRKEWGKQSTVCLWASLTHKRTLQTKDIPYKTTNLLPVSLLLISPDTTGPATSSAFLFFFLISVWLTWWESKWNLWSRAGVSLSTDLLCIICLFSWTCGRWWCRCGCYCRGSTCFLALPTTPRHRGTAREAPCTEPHLFLLCFLTLNPAPVTMITTTKKGQMHFLHFLIISKAMYHCFL